MVLRGHRRHPSRRFGARIQGDSLRADDDRQLRWPRLRSIRPTASSKAAGATKTACCGGKSLFLPMLPASWRFPRARTSRSTAALSIRRTIRLPDKDSGSPLYRFPSAAIRSRSGSRSGMNGEEDSRNREGSASFFFMDCGLSCRGPVRVSDGTASAEPLCRPMPSARVRLQEGRTCSG